MFWVITLIFISGGLTGIERIHAETLANIETLQQRLDQIREEESASNKNQKQLLNKIIFSLKNQEQLKNQIDSLRKEIDNQPAKIKSEQIKLEKEFKKPSFKVATNISNEQLNKSILSIDTRILEVERDMALLQQERSQAESRQQILREELTGLRLEQEVTENPRSTEFAELRQQLANAEFKQRQLRLQALELELLALPSRADIAYFIWQQLDEERKQQINLREELNALKQLRQRNELEKTLRNVSDGLTEDNVPEILLSAYRENQHLSNELRSLLASIDQTDEDLSILQQQLVTISTTFKALNQQLEFGVGHITPPQRRFIFNNRDPIDTQKTTDSINVLRLEMSLVDQKKNDSLISQNNIESLSGEETLDDNQKIIYAGMLSDRLRLTEQLTTAFEQQITSMNQLLSIEKQINQQISKNSDLIVKQLLWTPASNPINLEWPEEIFISLKQVSDHWNSEPQIKLITLNDSFSLHITGLIITIIGIFWLRLYHRKSQGNWCLQIGNVVHDRFHHSFQEMLLAIITASPIPLTVWIIQYSLINSNHPNSDTIYGILSMVSVTTWILLSIRNLFKTPCGLFPGHFGTNENLLAILNRKLVILCIFGLPISMIYLYLWDIDSDQVRSGLVRIVMLSANVCMFLFLFSLWKIRASLNQLLETSHLWLKVQSWILLSALLNIALLVLTIAGYTFTVTSIVYATLQIALVLFAVLILYKQGMRLVLISERRLEFDRAKTRRAEILAAREKKEDELPLETNYINMQTVSDHSRTLLKTVTLVSLLIFLWSMVGELLPFLGALDSVQMWSTFSEDGEIIQQITLKSVFLGIIILLLSWLAAYNLPGLFELLILRNMDLTPGTGYAISTLSKYLLLLIGVLGAFSHFGLEWGKLQWLVAALSVGLGFGLQEIVANFVSGLIILFEKPVRIGDTVTIDNLTGTVTKIQIRATTIVDWDRKEVIIPNKTFITQQLINWSLTDSVTRIVITIGVAYGSDTELARQILVDTALEEARILKDPKPEAYFTTFADSTLNIELRIYVNAMSDRLEMTHVVNTKIAKKFKEAGIEIAFPQLDVHITKND